MLSEWDWLECVGEEFVVVCRLLRLGFRALDMLFREEVSRSREKVLAVRFMYILQSGTMVGLFMMLR